PFRCTNTSPGNMPMISLAGTRLSEQPIHSTRGACCLASLSKKPGVSVSMRLAQVRLFSNRPSRNRRSSASTILHLVLRLGDAPTPLQFDKMKVAAVNKEVVGVPTKPQATASRRRPLATTPHRQQDQRRPEQRNRQASQPAIAS